MKNPEVILMKKSTVRLTGLLYLLVIICAGFSQGYVRGNLYVIGDAVATASNIQENEILFRLGLVLDLIAFILDAFISVMLYQMLKSFGKTLALVSSAFRLLAHPAIGSLNLLNHYMALHILNNPKFLLTFNYEQLELLSLLLMDAHRYGYLIAGGIFGIHCFILGVLLYKSNMIPNYFGLLMILAAMGYLMETFGDFLYPGNEETLAWIVGISAVLGEVSLALYMLIKGTKKSYIAKSIINQQ